MEESICLPEIFLNKRISWEQSIGTSDIHRVQQVGWQLANTWRWAEPNRFFASSVGNGSSSDFVKAKGDMQSMSLLQLTINWRDRDGEKKEKSNRSTAVRYRNSRLSMILLEISRCHLRVCLDEIDQEIGRRAEEITDKRMDQSAFLSFALNISTDIL